MAKASIQKVPLISDTYIRNKFKSVQCKPLKVPEVSFDCHIEMDVNSDGAMELQKAARDRVKKYVDERVSIVVSELPKMAHKVEEIAEHFCEKWPADKSEAELEKKLEVVIEKEIKAHNTIVGNAMKGIEAGIPKVVEEARKEVGKRKKAIKNMKIKTYAKVGIAAGITLGVTIAGLIALVGGVVATIATGGIAAIVFAAIGAAIAGLGAVIGGVATVIASLSKATITADKALADLKKSMKAVNEHKMWAALSKLPDKDRNSQWQNLKTKLSPAFQAIEVKAKNYEATMFTAMKAASKAHSQVERLLNESEKIDAKIKKEIAKNKDAGKTKEVKKLLADKTLFEKAVDGVFKTHEKTMDTLETYHDKAEEIHEIVADYKQDTPPRLQKAYAIVTTLKEIAPSIAQLKKLVEATKTAATSFEKDTCKSAA